MKVLFKVDRETGKGYAAAIDPTNGEHRKAADVGPGQEVELDIASDVVTSVDQVSFGAVVDSETGDTVAPASGEEAKEPADTPGGGNEGSPAAGQDQGDVGGDVGGQPEPDTPADQTTDPSSEGANAGGGEGGQPPVGGGELGGAQTGEPAQTSAASEKPLYLVNGDAVPDGFEPSGLETPEGKTLFHFGSDTAGQSATGNADGVSVYADADDNEKPVQPATPAEGQETAAA